MLAFPSQFYVYDGHLNFISPSYFAIFKSFNGDSVCYGNEFPNGYNSTHTIGYIPCMCFRWYATLLKAQHMEKTMWAY